MFVPMWLLVVAVFYYFVVLPRTDGAKREAAFQKRKEADESVKFRQRCAAFEALPPASQTNVLNGLATLEQETARLAVIIPAKPAVIVSPTQTTLTADEVQVKREAQAKRETADWIQSPPAALLRYIMGLPGYYEHNFEIWRICDELSVTGMSHEELDECWCQAYRTAVNPSPVVFDRLVAFQAQRVAEANTAAAAVADAVSCLPGFKAATMLLAWEELGVATPSMAVAERLHRAYLMSVDVDGPKQ